MQALPTIASGAIDFPFIIPAIALDLIVVTASMSP